ncbi:hypothetical protein L1N85_26370 [Paenibacillus alkaliterrae]|uniref:hypothetical protein n=1 Tax=Paenibacillus alkaliterrae TaxID=320909 RepID=UPI001F3DDF28|nr:hypothetical protein [Paenibacillus alkaliterrae]MCF2941853.1 hypothetical protein [Paenibacillus alkaliterrae]
MVIRDNGSIKHINDAQQEEEALPAFNPTILNIRFPQLIGTGDEPIIRKYFVILDL